MFAPPVPVRSYFIYILSLLYHLRITLRILRTPTLCQVFSSASFSCLSLDERDGSLDHGIVALFVVPQVALADAVQRVTLRYVPLRRLCSAIDRYNAHRRKHTHTHTHRTTIKSTDSFLACFADAARGPSTEFHRRRPSYLLPAPFLQLHPSSRRAGQNRGKAASWSTSWAGRPQSSEGRATPLNSSTHSMLLLSF